MSIDVDGARASICGNVTLGGGWMPLGGGEDAGLRMRVASIEPWVDALAAQVGPGPGDDDEDDEDESGGGSGGNIDPDDDEGFDDDEDDDDEEPLRCSVRVTA
jgi:hypothetical protein